jgi:iron complex outermembrane recepter protein
MNSTNTFRQPRQSAATRKHVRAGSITLLVTLASSTAGFAQDVSQPAAQKPQTERIVLEEVLVTGSRIRREGFDTLQPTTVIDAELIESRGATNVADVLNEMPSFGIPGNSPAAGQSDLAVGQNFLDFYGLGSQRTLTLVNGMRFPSANTPSINGPTRPGLQVDLNMIPTALIERVETIAVGGAPIYGADAVAGTVNIILKKNFTGFDATASGGMTESGDAGEYRVQTLYGLNFNEDKGNLVFNFEYGRQDPLRASEREATAAQYSFQPPTDPDSPYQNVLIRDSRISVTNFNGLPLIARQFSIFGGQATDENGAPLQFSSSGDLVPFDVGQPTGGPIFYRGGDGLNLGATASLLTQSERHLGNVFLNYELTDKVRMRAEAWYSRNDAIETVNQPTYNSHIFTSDRENDSHFIDGPFVVRLNNAFLTPQARGIMARNIDFDQDGIPDNNLDLDNDGIGDTPGFYIDKGSVDIQKGSAASTSQAMYRGLLGFEGELDWNERTYHWDATYARGRTTGEARWTSHLIDRINQAVDAVQDADGNIVCRDQSNGCAPLNIFTNAPSDAAVRFVTAQVVNKTSVEQDLFSANLSGALATLPGGDIGFAIGVDYRRESSSFKPDFLTTSGLLPGTTLTSVAGEFSTKEIYGEVLIPLVGRDMDVPLIHKLEAEGAIRYVDNSRAGGDMTWTAGGRYAPIQDIEFRGNLTRSIRAPAITELFLPDAQVATFASDPCDSRYIDQGNTPARRSANCGAAGITQPFNSLIVNASQLAISSGNLDLRNEEAKAKTVGVILRPRFAPDLVISIDWVDIRLTDAIEALDATTALQACYDSADYPSADVCSLFTRDEEGQIDSMRIGFANAGSVRFSGVTANIAYGLDIGRWGRLGVGGSYQYTDKLQTSITGSDFDENAGEIGNNQHRATAGVTWSYGDLRWFVQGQYLSSAVFDNADNELTRDVKGLDAWWLFNSALSYTFASRLTLQLNVDNLFDTDAPRYAAVGGGSDPNSGFGISTYFAGLMGRSYMAAVRYKF